MPGKDARAPVNPGVRWDESRSLYSHTKSTRSKAASLAMTSKNEIEQKRPILMWLVVVVLLAFVSYQIFSGIYLKKVGVPGLFEIEFFAKKPSDERERAKATIPYIKDAYSDELNAAREKYTQLSYPTIEDKILMCGGEPGCKGDYTIQQLIDAAKQLSHDLRPLAHFYSVLAQCIENEICSARIAYESLCADATEKYYGVAEIRQHVLDRMKWEGIDAAEIAKMGEELERDSRVKEGLSSFKDGCLKWNQENPDSKVTIKEKTFIVYR